MTKRIVRYGLSGLFLLLWGAPAFAGGLYLYEIGSPDVGLAAAGYAARAQDASTAFSNPAGMTRLKQSQVQFGAQPMYLTSSSTLLREPRYRAVTAMTAPGCRRRGPLS